MNRTKRNYWSAATTGWTETRDGQEEFAVTSLAPEVDADVGDGL